MFKLLYGSFFLPPAARGRGDEDLREESRIRATARETVSARATPHAANDCGLLEQQVTDPVSWVSVEPA